MTKFTAISTALAGALLLTACGTSTTTTNETTENVVLENFDAGAADNVVLANDLGTADTNFSVDSNSLDNVTTGDGNAL